MSVRTKFLSFIILGSLLGCAGPDVSKWENPAIDREAKKFATHPDKARLYIYNVMSPRHKNCPEPIVASEGPVDKKGAETWNLKEIEFPQGKQIFSLTYSHAELCNNDYVVLDVKTGLAVLGFGSCTIQFMAEPEHNYYFRYYSKSFIVSDDWSGYKNKQQFYVDVCFQQVEPDIAKLQIKRGMRLVVSNPDYIPKR